jgi:hypothetical protein
VIEDTLSRGRRKDTLISHLLPLPDLFSRSVFESGSGFPSMININWSCAKMNEEIQAKAETSDVLAWLGLKASGFGLA